MGTRHDLRRQERRPCSQDITVTWRDGSGDNKFTTAKTVDICETGIRMQMPEALPLHTYITVRAKKLGLLGNASVRHCFRTGASEFSVGAEFTAGLRWTPERHHSA